MGLAATMAAVQKIFTDTNGLWHMMKIKDVMTEEEIPGIAELKARGYTPHTLIHGDNIKIYYCGKCNSPTVWFPEDDKAFYKILVCHNCKIYGVYADDTPTKAVSS